MKINTSKIKSWDFKRRLTEIETRLEFVQEFVNANDTHGLHAEELEQVFQIIKYWKSHMKGKDEENPKKRRKYNPNLWS